MSLSTLAQRIAVLCDKIVAELLSIWRGNGSGGSESVPIQHMCVKGISGVPLFWTGVGIPFGLQMWIGFGRRSRLCRSFLLILSVE